MVALLFLSHCLSLLLVGQHDIDNSNQHNPRARLKNQPMLQKIH